MLYQYLDMLYCHVFFKFSSIDPEIQEDNVVTLQWVEYLTSYRPNNYHNITKNNYQWNKRKLLQYDMKIIEKILILVSGEKDKVFCRLHCVWTIAALINWVWTYMAQNYVQSNINNHCKHLQSNRMFGACVRGGMGGSIKSQVLFFPNSLSWHTQSPQ